MSQGFVRTDFTRGEAIGGLVWLSIAAFISVMLEIVYLGTWVTLPGDARIALPYTIVIAFLFNLVLTRSGKLWTTNPAFALVPLYAWTGGFLFFMLGPAITGDQLLANSIRSVGLLLAGIAGGIWPLLRSK